MTGGVPWSAVTSGTAALHIAYAAAGVGPGDEVVTTPMTFVATAAGAALLGATVVFADVEHGHRQPRPGGGRGAGQRRAPRSIAAVDYAGHPATTTRCRPMADRAGALTARRRRALDRRRPARPAGRRPGRPDHLLVLPDQEPHHRRGRRVASDRPGSRRSGPASSTTIGLVRDRDRLRARRTRAPWHQEVHAFGLNYRLPDVLCALGLGQLRRLPEFARRRAEIDARYDAALGRRRRRCGTPAARAGRRPGVAPLPAAGPRRPPAGGVRAHARGRASACRSTTCPSTGTRSSRTSATGAACAPTPRRSTSEELSLPMFPDLTDDQVDRVVEEIRKFFGA